MMGQLLVKNVTKNVDLALISLLVLHVLMLQEMSTTIVNAYLDISNKTLKFVEFVLTNVQNVILKMFVLLVPTLTDY